jgi:alkane 1-monooxygenase
MAGFSGLLLWIVVAFIGKELLEVQNYFAHYGLVREPGKPVQPRHSWNSTHWMSTNVLYSLARHSHHHAEADAPYWTLNAEETAPALPGGYLMMMPVAMIPPLFKRLMTPALNAWDRNYATPAERELARKASLESGMRGLDLAVPGAA